jgi:electron transport complex protein RnfA
MELIALGFGAVLVNNVILSQFLGICSFVGVSKKRSNALGMGLAVIGVLLLSSAITWVIYNLLLVQLEITYLYLIVFILVIASLVQVLEMILKKYIPSLYKAMGIYLPLITTNCAILGVTTQMVRKSYDFAEVMVYSLGIGLGYLLVMVIFSFIREKLEIAPIPKPFKGLAIALVVAGLMALAFQGFQGIV